MSTATPSASVLISDDDPGFLKVLDLAFSSAGYAVETAVDGAAALERVGERTFDLYVLDILMPGATGWEVLDRVVGATPPGEPLPRAILMTGFNQEFVVDMDVLQKEGVGAMLLKPFTAEAMLGEAERVLAAKRRLARARSKDPARA